MTWELESILSAIRDSLTDGGTTDPALAKHIEYHRAVILALKKKYESKYPSAEHLGLGGSGEVLRLFPDPSQQDVGACVKYPQPTLGQSSMISLSDVLDNEIDKLRRLNHQHIMPLLDAGILQLEETQDIAAADRNAPYYLMPFVQAVDLHDFITKSLPKPSLRVVTRLLYQTSLALDYIHKRDFVHLDVKPQNIFVENFTEEPTALLADFGFCKKVHTKPSEGHTLVMGTDGYIHPELMMLMQNPTRTSDLRVRDSVPREKLKQSFDRYSMAATIVSSLASYVTSNDKEPVSGYLVRGLQIVALRSSDGHAFRLRQNEDHKRVLPEDLFQEAAASLFKYEDSEQLATNLGLLAIGTRRLAVEPELEGFGAGIALPPRVLAPLTNRVMKTVDSLPIRRLSGVSQLALCQHVYPGATHSRKEHCIGTYNTAIRMLKHLQRDDRNPLCSLLLTENHQKTFVLAALLHDFAHIPLMHDLEDGLQELRQDVYASEILERRWGTEEFQRDLDMVCDEWCVKREDLAMLIGSDRRTEAVRYPPAFDLLRSLLDSAIDADKIDYLLRDSVHAGVQYGAGVDFERLIRVITTGLWWSSARETRVLRCTLAAWRKGQAAAEGVIAARYNMHSQVYGHKTVRAARAMLNLLVWRWQLSGINSTLNGKQVADRLFQRGFGQGPPTGDVESGSNTTEKITDVPASRNPKDNLPYSEASLIRWLAAECDDAAAMKGIAEQLIQRDLYKMVYELDENDVLSFMDRAYPKFGWENVRRCSLTPKKWIQLLGFLGQCIREFIRTKGLAVGQGMLEDSRPVVLVDVSIPKSMRTQKELVIVTDVIPRDVAWEVIADMAQVGSSEGLLGLSVAVSPVYEAFGGGSGGIDRTRVRLYARPDMAPVIRSHVGKMRATQWLNEFTV